MQKTKLSQRVAGFTLVELLVVLMVVCILTAILFSVFGRVRENGRRGACQSNLRQIGLGIIQYVQDNDGRFPTQSLPSEVLPNLSKSVFQCPSASPSESLALNHYGLTGFILEIDWQANKVYGRHDSTFSQSSTTFMLFEATGPSEEFTGLCVVNQPYRIPHFNGANFGFVDGHVKWLTASQANEIGCANPLGQ